MKNEKACRTLESYGSIAERRVAVAKDALAWVRAGALRAESMTYVSPTNPLYRYEPPDKQLRDTVFDTTSVCGLGALFVAHVVRFDRCTVGEFRNSFCCTRDLIVQKLGDTFDPQTLLCVEHAFECWAHGMSPDVKEAERFGARYSDKTERLVAILKSIIRNNGDFPSKRPAT
jgi:hypothetical protein